MEEHGDLYNMCGGAASSEASEQERLEHLENVEYLRRKIKYYFMNPCEKYYARGRKPWKLVLQLIKIAIITVQLVSFGLSNQMVVNFKEENLITFKHLFLKDYVDGQMSTYAVYRQRDLYEHVNYVLEQYGQLYNITLGNHEYEKNGTSYTPLVLCQSFYRNGSIYAGNESFEIDAQVESACIKIDPMSAQSIKESFSKFEFQLKRMVSITITFTLKAINLETVRHRELPDCYDFTIMISFSNNAHSGRIKIDLDDDIDVNECKDWKVTGATSKNKYAPVMFDSLIIITCLVSLSLCTRSVINGVRLQFEYTSYCNKYCSKQVPLSDRLEFVNGWYLLIIISDVLVIVGSILKIEIQTKVLTSYDICSIFLGTGTMLVWIGVIRYMGFFRKYNILILTLRAAIPNVIRFICCAGIIYISYCFCGWIVLGPYHEKFRTLNVVSECLFSLINGDDMFPTFKNMKSKNNVVWIFSRVYLYSFVSLFIYMVLSLFITIITDTYDTIKQQQQSGVPTSDLQQFLSECKDLPSSGVFRLDGPNSCCIDRCIDIKRLWRGSERLTSEA